MNWKEKVAAFAMLLGLLTLAVFITPQTHAACYFQCVSENCYYPQGMRGHYAIGEAHGQDEVLLYDNICQGYQGNQLFQSCTWFFCGMNGAGIHVRLDGNVAHVFPIRNKEDEKQIVASVSKIGLAKTTVAYRAIEVPAKDFNNWREKFLALNKDKGCSTTEGK